MSKHRTWSRNAAWAALALVVPLVAEAAEWTPNAWRGENTVDLRTQCPSEGEHWFPVWLVVLDGDLYVRLGTKAASRVECTSPANVLGVKIAGQRFDSVLATPAPEDRDRVAAAMGEKYWSDLFIRYAPHPLTLRLRPK